MPRKKKSEEAELEATLETNEADEAEDVETLEAQEAEALEAEDEVPAVEAAEETAEDKAETKPKRKRAPRRRKTAATDNALQSLTTAAAEESTAVEVEETEEAVAAKPAARKARAKADVATPPDTSHLREDAEVAEVSIHKSMESMVKQWASVKEISSSVCTNLEKVAGLLNSLETDYSSASTALAKENRSKSSTVAKVAAGISALALLLSILSFSLSQSVRHTVLEANNAKTAPSATAQAGSQWNPSEAVRGALGRKDARTKDVAVVPATKAASNFRKEGSGPTFKRK